MKKRKLLCNLLRIRPPHIQKLEQKRKINAFIEENFVEKCQVDKYIQKIVV